MAPAKILPGATLIGPMLRIELNSTSLNSVGYLDGQAILELEFKSGAVYRYQGVPPETYRGLLAAESKGTYFNCQIRNRFSYTNIRNQKQTV